MLRGFDRDPLPGLPESLKKFFTCIVEKKPVEPCAFVAARIYKNRTAIIARSGLQPGVLQQLKAFGVGVTEDGRNYHLRYPRIQPKVARRLVAAKLADHNPYHKEGKK